MRTSNIFLIFLSFIFCTVYSFSQALQTDLQKRKLNGKVKSISEISKNEYREAKSELLFNDKGNLIALTSFERQLFKHKIEFSYDIKGYLTAQSTKDSLGKVNSKTIFNNDPKGNVIKFTQYDAEGKISEMKTYKLDQKGNIIQETIFEGPVTIQSIVTIKYDAKGKITERSEKDPALNKVSTWIYKYDSLGTVIEKEWWGIENNNKNRKSRQLYAPEYKNGLLEKIRGSINSDYENENNVTLYTYNKSNQITEEYTRRIFPDGDRPAVERTTRYDDKNNIIYIAEWDGINMNAMIIDLFNYEYDSFGNWVKMEHSRTLNKKVFKETEERIITYY